MSNHDLPPELRQRRSTRPEAIPLELPLDDEVTQPPLRQPDRTVPEQGNPEPFLRRSFPYASVAPITPPITGSTTPVM
jgi:hypothetical protein